MECTNTLDGGGGKNGEEKKSRSVVVGLYYTRAAANLDCSNIGVNTKILGWLGNLCSDKRNYLK